MRCSRFVLVLILPVLTPAMAGDEKPAEDEKPMLALRALYRKTADKYAFFHDAEGNQPLLLTEKPVMKWANDNDYSGDVFVWTRDDRPEVIGGVHSGPRMGHQRQVSVEFHLLATDPIAPADLLGRLRWAPTAGLERHPVDDAPKPADSPVVRLTQMRQILRDFSAHMDVNGGEWELRLLPQPLLRYQPKDGPVVDGALFTFVWTRGTDPELILLLECRKTSAGRAWFCAPVRFSHRALWLKHHDAEVWRAPVHQEPALETGLLYTTHGLELVDDPRLEAK